MITAIRHVGIVVTDLEKAITFWCDIMGFKILLQMEENGPHIDAMMGLSGVKLKTTKLAAPDGNIIELLYFASHKHKSSWQGSPYSTGLTHIAFTVEDIDDAYKNLKKAGVTFPADPQISPDGSVKVIYATGPEGILIELVEMIEQ